MNTIIDETVVLRYLLDDDPVQSPQAARIIASRGARVYTETIARVVVTLRDSYEVPRARIADAMEALLDDVLVDEPTVITLAVRLFGRTRMDFTDCLLTARTGIYGDEIMSFGKPLIQGVIDYRAAHGKEAVRPGGGLRGGGGWDTADAGSVDAGARAAAEADRTIDRLRAAGKQRPRE